jgi:glycosyltransferase involved in cell wall biosynthesis
MVSVTALIITYRRPILLARTIKSVLAQTHKDVRIVVCDDASGDETASVVNQYIGIDNRISYYCNSSNLGGVENYRRSVQHVTTDIFSFVSDDEVLFPNFYEKAIEKLTLHPSAVFVAMGVLCATENGTLVASSSGNLPEGYYEVNDGIIAMSKYGPPIWSGTCFRSSLIAEYGGPGQSGNLASDHDYLYRVASCNPFYISNELSVFFPVHVNQISSGLHVDVVFNNRRDFVHQVENSYRIEKRQIKREVRKNLIARANRYLFTSLGVAFVRGDLARVSRVLSAAIDTPFVFIKVYSSFLLFASRHKILSNILMGIYKFRKMLQTLKVPSDARMMSLEHLAYIRSLDVPANGVQTRD